MAGKVLDNVKMNCNWTSYIGSVEGALRGAGLWDGETYELMGMTGMAFHFIVHHTLCPSSVTVYDWGGEHQAMMDRIGVVSEQQIVCDIRMNTFPRLQALTVQRIKESIDRGIAVVTWAPTPILEFGIIKGYDDEDGVFFVDGLSPMGTPDPLLYTNLGKSEAPMLYCQIIHERLPADLEKTYRDSLAFAVAEWNKENHTSPGHVSGYASGRKGYANLLGALERGDFSEFGLAYLLAVYSAAKAEIPPYLDSVARNSAALKGLVQPAALYRQIAGKYKRMTELIPFSGANGVGASVDRTKIPEVLGLARECKDLEEQAMASIGEALD